MNEDYERICREAVALPVLLRLQLLRDLKATLSPNDLDEDLHLAALEVHKQEGPVSAALLQRRLRIGNERASAMIRRLRRE
jgi:hypothetical protein